MKIAIVGAGVCGLYLGWRLSQKGEKVVIFEKKERIGKECCSGLFSERILDFIPESKKLIKNRIQFFFLHLSQKDIKIKFSREMLVINHDELDRLLADLSKKAGAKILLNYQVTSKNFPKIENYFEKIIGCDGVNSFLRERLKEKKPEFRLGIQGFVKEKDFSNFVEIWPTEKGFIWKIPRGEKKEYGIIEKPKKANFLFQRFLKERKITISEIRSALIPQGLILPRNSRITLCGDAMGLTKPWSGGGVIWGLMACELLLKNFPDFLKYKKEVERFFLPKIFVSKNLVKIAYFLFKFPWIFPKNWQIESDFLL